VFLERPIALTMLLLSAGAIIYPLLSKPGRFLSIRQR